MEKAISHESFYYLYGGFELLSSFELRGLESSLAAGDDSPSEVISLVSGASLAKTSETPLYCWKGRYQTSLWKTSDGLLFRSGLGPEFFVDSTSRKIQCDITRDQWTELHSEVFTRRVLPRLVTILGRMVLHASALGTRNGALIFLGESGTGKSTLCAFLQQQLKGQVFSDDTAILGSTEAGIRIFPAENAICLWQDSHRVILHETNPATKLTVYPSKFMCPIRLTQKRQPQPIRALFFLGETDNQTEAKPKLKVATTREAVSFLYELMICLNPKDQKSRFSKFSFLESLVHSTRCYFVNSSHDFDALPPLAQAIQEVTGI